MLMATTYGSERESELGWNIGSDLIRKVITPLLTQLMSMAGNGVRVCVRLCVYIIAL